MASSSSYNPVSEVNSFAAQWSDPSSRAFNNSDNHGRTIFKNNASSNATVNAVLLDGKDISKGELVFVVGNNVNREISCIGSLSAVNAMLAAEYKRAIASRPQLLTTLTTEGEADSRNTFAGTDRQQYTNSTIWACTLYGIFEKIRFLGVMDNIDGRKSSGNLTSYRDSSALPGVHRNVRQKQVVVGVTVAGKGIAKNIWGGKRDFNVGRRLYLIIRKEGSDKPFQITPYTMNVDEAVPTNIEFYHDQAGKVQRSGVIRVGKAASAPMHDYLDGMLVNAIVGAQRQNSFVSNAAQVNYSYADDVEIALANTPCQVLVF